VFVFDIFKSAVQKDGKEETAKFQWVFWVTLPCVYSSLFSIYLMLWELFEFLFSLINCGHAFIFTFRMLPMRSVNET